MIGQPVGPGGGPLRNVAAEVLLVDEELDVDEALDDVELSDDDDDDEDLICERINRSALFLTRKKRPFWPPVLFLRPLSQARASVNTDSVASKSVVADTKTAAPALLAGELASTTCSSISSR